MASATEWRLDGTRRVQHFVVRSQLEEGRCMAGVWLQSDYRVDECGEATNREEW